MSTEPPINHSAEPSDMIGRFEQLREMVESEFDVEEGFVEHDIPTFYVRLRPDSKEAFLRLTKNIEPLEKELVCPIKFNSYNGESESFFRNTGRKNAWALGRSFFTENSGTALHFLEMFDREDIFNPMNWMFDRFLHSFCNELGFSNEEEGKMLFEYSIHRATVEARNKKDRQGAEEILRHLKTKLQSITKEFLSQNLP